MFNAKFVLKMILHFLLICFGLYSAATASRLKPDLPTLGTTTKSNSKEPIWGLLHSLDQYKRWAIRESEIFELLLVRKDILEKTQHFIKISLNNVRKKSNNANFPLPTIRQLATKLTPLKKHLYGNSSTPSDILNLLEINSQQISSTDLFFSISSLLQPQQFNGLYPNQIAKGLEIDVKKSHGGHLNLPQMLEIGQFALSRKWYTRSVEWLHFSYIFAVNLENQVINHQIAIPLTMDLVSRLLTLFIQEHNRILTQPETEENYVISTNLFSRSLKEKSDRPRKFKRWSSPPLISYPRKTFDRLLSDNEDMQYATLCKDLNYQTYTPYSRFTHLKCFYEKSVHAYFYINPVKTEHLSDAPPVYMYHEVVTDKLNEYLRKINGYKVEMNWTSSENRKEIEDRTEKTSTVKGITKGFTKEFKVLEWISEKLTGLKLSIEESNNQSMAYTVYTYGRMAGAHTDVEFDKLNKFEKLSKYLRRKNGERLATLLYYLHLADLGGQTAFCQGGFNVVPQKNSLIVYYHLYKNGTVRPDIYHGSCPVLHGTKIILLAMTRYFPSWHNFKCSLNKNE